MSTELPFAFTAPWTGRWSGPDAAYDVLLVLYPQKLAETPADYLRFAATPRAVSVAIGDEACDGSYPPRATLGALNESVGEEPVPRVILPDLAVTIARHDDGDGKLIDLINAHGTDHDGWVLRLYAKAATATLRPAADLVYEGVLGAGAFTITAGAVELRATSRLAQYDMDFPVRKFSDVFDDNVRRAWRQGDGGMGPITGPYNPIAEDARDRIVPVLYGRWTDPPSHYWLPGGIVNRLIGAKYGDTGSATAELAACLCLANTAVDGSGRGIAQVPERAWWKKGDGSRHGGAGRNGKFDVSANSGNPDADGCGHAVVLRLAGSDDADVSYYDGDIVLARRAAGNRNASGELIEEPAAIIYDLLTDPYYGHVDAAFIDDSLNPASDGFVRTGLRFRGHLAETKKLITEHIAEICRDAGLLFGVENGKFAVRPNKLYRWEFYGRSFGAHPVDRVRCLDTARHTLWLKEYEFHGVRLRYAWNPSTEEYAKVHQRGATVAVGENTEPREPYLEIESRWIWRDEDARVLAGTLKEILRHRGRLVEFGLPLAGLDIAVGDRVSFTGDGLHGAVFYVTTVDKDYGAGTATIKAARMALRWHGGLWTADDAPAYAELTDEDDKKLNWYWTDDDGLVPPDTAVYTHWIEWEE